MDKPTWRTFPINSDVKVKIDEDDYKKVEQLKWYIHKKDNIPVHDMTHGEYNRHKLRMTDVIMNIEPISGFGVEFLNGDSLDLRKANLVVVEAKARMLGRNNKNS